MRGPTLIQRLRLRIPEASLHASESAVHLPPSDGAVALEDPPSDAEYAFSRADLGGFLDAVRGYVGEDGSRLDSPALLTRALQAIIVRLDGSGTADVRRSPAGLQTPEYWRVHLRGADARTLAAFEQAVRIGSFAGKTR